MADALKEFLVGAVVEIGPGLDYYGTDSQGYRQFDISRARESFGYEPQHDVKAGVRDYIDLMRRLGLRPGTLV